MGRWRSKEAAGTAYNSQLPWRSLSVFQLSSKLTPVLPLSAHQPHAGMPTRNFSPSSARMWWKDLETLLDMKDEKSTPAQKIPKQAGLRWFLDLNSSPSAHKQAQGSSIPRRLVHPGPELTPFNLEAISPLSPPPTSDQLMGHWPGAEGLTWAG